MEITINTDLLVKQIEACDFLAATGSGLFEGIANILSEVLYAAEAGLNVKIIKE